MAKALSAPAGEEQRRQVVLRFWESALGYWRGPGSGWTWALCIGLVVLVFVQIAVQYRITVWNRDFFDALERRDGSSLWSQALLLLPLSAAAVALAVAAVGGRMLTQIRWRRHLSAGLLEHWLWNGRYFQLNLMAGDHDNAEMRIAEDARVATEAPIDFAVGILTAAVTSVTFIAVLWRVGGSITVQGIEIPGFLVLTAVVYASLSTLATLTVARRFVAVAEHKNGREADLRYAAVRLRENGESIALLGGEAEERQGLGMLLDRVRGAWLDLMGQ
ncbi:MAG: SbmA/BacA-like family transporter, partial [Alphaproteobacteria bacterium]